MDMDMVEPHQVAGEMDHDEHDGDMGAEDGEEMDVDPAELLRPHFPPLTATEDAGSFDEVRIIRVPPHRYTPLKEAWDDVVDPIVDHMRLMIRMNTKKRCVELKASEETEDTGALQKGEDFVKAFMLGFEVRDAIALLRLDDLYVDSFEVHDVKMLRGDHLSRAIGRIAGQGGKTKHAIENATKTRIVVADRKIHILGAYANIHVARDAICSLILGSPPGKVYNHMRQVAARLSSRY
jgi:RNA-binding protein PNO1